MIKFTKIKVIDFYDKPLTWHCEDENGISYIGILIDENNTELIYIFIQCEYQEKINLYNLLSSKNKKFLMNHNFENQKEFLDEVPEDWKPQDISFELDLTNIFSEINND